MWQNPLLVDQDLNKDESTFPYNSFTQVIVCPANCFLKKKCLRIFIIINSIVKITLRLFHASFSNFVQLVFEKNWNKKQAVHNKETDLMWDLISGVKNIFPGQWLKLKGLDLSTCIDSTKSSVHCFSVFHFHFFSQTDFLVY